VHPQYRIDLESHALSLSSIVNSHVYLSISPILVARTRSIVR
jgi:hypothetical protein